MENLKVVSVSDVKTEKARSDKKVSREYITVAVVDSSNPLAIKTISRNFFQLHNADGSKASWGALNAKSAKGLVGKTIPGKIVRLETEAYMIGDRQASSYTSFILPGEDAATIFKQLGHPVAKADATPAVAKLEDLITE